jgi:outer membrane protein
MMFDILLEAALRAAFIAAAALTALWVLRVRSAAVRHRVWTVVTLAMLALPFWIAYAPDVTLRVMPPASSEVSGTVAPPSDSVGVAMAPPQSAPSEAVVLTPAPSWNWRAWLLALYFAGAAALLTRLAVGTVRVGLLAREATVIDGLLTSARIATPFTFGLLAPRILLPEDWQRWSATRLAVVLDHEHAHRARRDPLVQWLALLNRAVFWFHPLAWWLERHLAALAEEACDAAVLARGHSRADYAEQLLQLARMSARRPVSHLVGTPMPGSALPTRIAMILDGRVGRPGSRTASASAAVLAMLAAAVLGTVTLAQETSGPLAQERSAPLTRETPGPLTQETPEPLARETPEPLARETSAARNLLDVYQLALANNRTVREAEAEYRTLAEARPQAPNAVAQAMADYEAARQELLIRVAEPYFGVFAAENALALHEAGRESRSRQLEQTERRFEVGLIGITDVVEARAGFDQAVADALTAQRALAEMRQALREVVGEPVGQLRPLVDDLPLAAPNPSNAEAWIETAMQRNPALASTRIRAEIAGGDSEAQRSVREDLERVARQVNAETRAAYIGVISEISRVRALEQSVRSSQSAVKATNAGFEVGTRTTVEVLTAQSNLRQSETAYARSRYDYALNVLRLQRAAGALTGQELEAITTWFE